MKRVLLLSILIFLFFFRYSEAQERNLYRNKPHAFSIVFPKGWAQQEGRGPNVVIVAVSDKGDSINIVVRKAPGESFNELTDNELNLLILSTVNQIREKYSDYQMHNSGITYLDNEKAIWFITSHTDKQAFSSNRFKTLSFQVAHKRKFYNITCNTIEERFKEVEPLCIKSVKSFRFEDSFIK